MLIVKFIKHKKFNFFSEIWSLQRKILILIGAETSAPFTLRLFFSSYLPGTLAIVMFIYGLCFYSQEKLELLKVFMVLPLILIGIMKTVARFRNDMPLYFLNINYVTNFFEEEEIFLKQREILLNNAKSVRYFVKIYLLVQLITSHCPIVVAWILSIYQHDFVYPSNLLLPFTNPNTLTGFFINQIILTLQSTTIFFSLTCAEVSNFLLAIFTRSMVDIFREKLSEIAIELNNIQNKKKNEEKNCEKIEEKFMEIVKKFDSYNIFVKNLTKSIQIYTFSLITFNNIGIGLSLVVALKISMPIGVSIAIFAMFQVTFACTSGAIISIEKEKFLNDLCGFPWYQMSPKMQKNFLIFVHSCQHSNVMKFPIIGEINLKVLQNFINVSYSYLMFLLHILSVENSK